MKLPSSTSIKWSTRVLYGNSAFRKKNSKYNAGLKNMPKLVRLGIGGNGRRCEQRPLANLKAGVHNAGY